MMLFSDLHTSSLPHNHGRSSLETRGGGGGGGQAGKGGEEGMMIPLLGLHFY